MSCCLILGFTTYQDRYLSIKQITALCPLKPWGVSVLLWPLQNFLCNQVINRCYLWWFLSVNFRCLKTYSLKSSLVIKWLSGCIMSGRNKQEGRFLTVSVYEILKISTSLDILMISLNWDATCCFVSYSPSGSRKSCDSCLFFTSRIQGNLRISGFQFSFDLLPFLEYDFMPVIL